MKQANDTLVARALLAEIQSAEPGAFGAPFTAERTYPTAQALDAVEGFRLTVAATQLASDLADRSGFQDSVGVEICVRCRIHSQPDQSLEYTAELDAARAFTAAVKDFLEAREHRRLLAMPTACLTADGVKNAPIYALDHLQDLHQYTSILAMTYRVTA